MDSGLESHVQEFEERIGVPAHFESDFVASQLPPAAEVQILRIVQEALLNVERHAEATEAWITLSSSRGTVDLTVRDNGRGLASNANGGQQTGQHGLRVMRERAGSIGGTLDITSGPGQGTEVRVSVPRGRYWT